jgi:hypothetical protein
MEDPDLKSKPPRPWWQNNAGGLLLTPDRLYSGDWGPPIVGHPLEAAEDFIHFPLHLGLSKALEFESLFLA